MMIFLAWWVRQYRAIDEAAPVLRALWNEQAWRETVANCGHRHPRQCLA